MNNTQLRIRIRRIERFGDAFSATVGGAALKLSGIFDGKFHVSKMPFVTIMLITAGVVYFVATWIVVEMAAGVTEDNNDGA